jgi:hypothetical protein
MRIVLLSPGVNPIAVNKHIIHVTTAAMETQQFVPFLLLMAQM